MNTEAFEQWLQSLVPGSVVSIRIRVPGNASSAHAMVGCEVDGCDRPHTAKGLCSLHYNRLHKRGSTDDPVRQPRSPKPCGVNSCTLQAVCRGFCDRHYQRFRRLGSAETPDMRFKTPRTCSVEGCDEISKGHGLCSTHYMAAKRRAPTAEVSGQPMPAPASRPDDERPSAWAPGQEAGVTLVDEVIGDSRQGLEVKLVRRSDLR